MLVLIPMGVLAQGWPANYGGVMLQGFYWDSYEDAKWTTLTSQADELSQYFKLIWVPNSGQTKNDDYWNSPDMGYMPVYWLKHNSCFGTQEELIQMIQTFKEKGTGFIEDVVINHKNGLTGWADFPNESYTNSTTNKTYSVNWCTDMSNLWGICSNDEVFTQNGGLHDGTQYTCSSDARYDEADNFDGCRDLDHTDSRVQDNIYNYLDFLKNELGYVGFRYDMVKGYKGYYTGLYNMHAQPEFSVGEYWDASYDNVVWDWINETGRPANWEPQSAAFDFPLKYRINEAFNNSNWTALDNKGIAGSPDWCRYAVTFVDNHDTYRNDGDRVKNNVLAANALILTMHGTPCVFLPHWKQYKPEIKKMIAARQAAGITNQINSTYEDQQYVIDNGKGYYLKVYGSTGSIILTLGNLYGTDVDTSGHHLVVSGDNFALYLYDGVYNQDTFDAIDAESTKDITVYVMKHQGQGDLNLYAWHEEEHPNGDWPGAQLSETVTLDDGTVWYKKTFHSSSVNVIVSKDGSSKTSDITNVTEDIYIDYKDDGTYKDYTSCYKGDISGNIVRAYFDAPSGWNYAWAWYGDKNYTGGNWPGHEMTKVGKSSTGNDIYRWRIPRNIAEGVPDKIIFSGNGQTGNLDFISGAYYDTYGFTSENCLYFDPVVMRNATFVDGVSWDGTTTKLAQGGTATAMQHSLYYPAGDYTVQAIVRGTDGGQVTLHVGTADLTNATAATVSLTGLAEGATSTVTTNGVVECVEKGINNGWHKVQAQYVMAEEGVLKVSLTSDAANWQVGGITIIKSADTQGYYSTTATQHVTDTNADVTNINGFSFYDRGVNKNALVIANSTQEPAYLPCNAVVNGLCNKLVLTDGAYDFYAPADFTTTKISYNRNFTADKKVTVCLPFDITSQEMTDLGIQAYEFTEVSTAGTFRFTPVNSMVANHPYVVTATGKAFEALSEKSVKKTDAMEQNIEGVTFKGTMKRMVLNSGDDAVYYGYSNGQFVKVGSNVGINPFRAFIVTGNDLGDAVQAVFDTDGIFEVNVKNMNDGIIYSIDGRRMGTSYDKNSLPKGLYIYNGSKFIVK